PAPRKGPMPFDLPAASLPLAAAVGQLIVPTLFGAERAGEPYDATAEAEAIARYGWGGVILFHGDRTETRRRIAALQAASAVPLLVAADMEHGAGQQLAGASVFPTAMAFGAHASEEAAYALGAHTAHEALASGINWVLAPVCDVTVNPANPIIHVRSFGGEPALVGRLAAAFVRGCQDHGALACAKHFPGHGDTGLDSHSRLATVEADGDRLRAVEWPPFRRAIEAGVATVMSAHLALPAFSDARLPATMDPAVMTGVLRQELGFGGLAVTDAMLMGGIERDWDPAEAAVRAVAAGCDMLLMPRDPRRAHAALMAAVADGRLAEARVYEAAERVLAAKARLVGDFPAPAGDPEALAREVAEGAVTLARGPAGFTLPEGAVAVAVDDGVEPDRLAAFEAEVRAAGLAFGGVLAEGREVAPEGTMLVLGVFSPIRPGKDRGLLHAALAERVRGLAARMPTVVVSFSSPFLVSQVPEAVAWALAYGGRQVQIAAALAALKAGRYPGAMPVALPASPPVAPARRGTIGEGPSFA
ncbi:MAG: glycoside hydrolase family 3 protein, partial [Candidatus Sericytochromatia bacterium]